MPRDRTCYRLKKQIRLSVDDETGVILDVEKGKYYSLSPVATTICLSLKNGTSVSQLLEVLARRYAVARSQLVRDIGDFLVRLKTVGICELTSDDEKSMDTD